MESESKTYHLGVETGQIYYILIQYSGTTCKAGIFEGGDLHHPIHSTVVDTHDPKSTVEKILEFINSHPYTYSSLGIAAFGPICLDKKDKHFGHVTTTPKVAWQFFNVRQTLIDGIKNKAPSMKIAFDTDVNVVALFEYLNGGHDVQSSLAYITVGTGIGIGLVINGQMVHGLVHPEGGHIKVPILKEDEEYEGVCPFHKNCLEGLCTNVSIAKRKGLKDVEENKDISDDDDVWRRVGHYLGTACANLVFTLSIEKIVIGGGVMNRTILYDIIRQHCLDALNGYISHPNFKDLESMRNVIVSPKIEHDLGIIAAVVVGSQSKETI